jgi:hypothetical protein
MSKIEDALRAQIAALEEDLWVEKERCMAAQEEARFHSRQFDRFFPHFYTKVTEVKARKRPEGLLTEVAISFDAPRYSVLLSDEAIAFAQYPRDVVLAWAHRAAHEFSMVLAARMYDAVAEHLKLPPTAKKEPVGE